MTREEAIKKIKEAMPTLWKETKEAIQVLIPEFAENEDEKIRKEMIRYFTEMKKGGSAALPYDDCIAYLERLKEYEITEEDKKIIPEALVMLCDDIINHRVHTPIKTDEEGARKIKAFLKTFNRQPHKTRGDWEKQKEQKPIPANSVGLKEQKPAEWSEDIIQKAVKEVGLTQYQIDWFKTNVFQPKREWSDEDEAAWSDLMWCIEQARKSAKDENDMGNIWFAENWVKNRLKSLRPQPKQEQNDYITPHKKFFKFIYDRLINVYKENPNVDYMRSFKERLDNLSFEEKQEWNEENEDMLNSCISSIEEAKENRYACKETDGDTSYDHEIAWLESLRPQPKAELTLLDENIIKAAVAFVEQNNHFNCWGGIDKHTVIKALRSLKPHWKPSEG